MDIAFASRVRVKFTIFYHFKINHYKKKTVDIVKKYLIYQNRSLFTADYFLVYVTVSNKMAHYYQIPAYNICQTIIKYFIRNKKNFLQSPSESWYPESVRSVPYSLFRVSRHLKSHLKFSWLAEATLV